jgi:tetratricopeptide (TPR) repeat protein
MLNRLWWAALTLAVLGLILLSLPYALSAHYLEKGSARLAQEDPAALRAAVEELERAIALDGRNVQARRQLARAYLALARPQSALTALQPAADVASNNPMVSLALVDAYAALGQADAVVHAYEAAGLDMPNPAAAAAYLRLAQERKRAGDSSVAADLWHRALVADPGNLYALLQLRDAAHVVGDGTLAAKYEEQLRYFALRSVAVPGDARLAEFQAQAMAQLVEAGIWTRATLRNVLAYQVWQFAPGEAAPRAERVLQSLMEKWPEDTDPRFYLAELYHRRGEWAQAEAAYRAVLDMDPAYAQAMLRLGMVLQAQGRLAEAARWYERYHALAPDDLLGLQRQVEVREAQGAPEVTTWREQLRAVTDDRRIAARMLGFSVDEVQLGDTLIRNGDFAGWVSGRPQWWSVSNMATGNPWNEGLFVGGSEDLSAPFGSALRIQGLWLKQQPDKQPGCWGYWYFDESARRIAALPLEADGWYLVSFDYRSEVYEQKGAALYVSDRAEVLWRGDRHLPSTGTAWYHVVIIASNRGGAQAVMRLLLRSWGSGIVEFDRVRVSPLMLPAGLRDDVAPVQFWSSGS